MQVGIGCLAVDGLYRTDAACNTATVAGHTHGYIVTVLLVVTENGLNTYALLGESERSATTTRRTVLLAITHGMCFKASDERRAMQLNSWSNSYSEIRSISYL